MARAIIQELLDALIAPIARQPIEIGIVLYINGEGRLAGLRHVRGHRGGIEMPMRTLIADALAFDATSAIMAHNHPSGDPQPSRDDLAVTRRLTRAFEAIGVCLIDHVVLAGTGSTSFRSLGRL